MPTCPGLKERSRISGQAGCVMRQPISFPCRSPRQTYWQSSIPTAANKRSSPQNEPLAGGHELAYRSTGINPSWIQASPKNCRN